MLKNYIRVTVRNLFKNSVYSFINITGLAVGIVCCILILLWVNDEVSYDKFLPKYNKLAQVWINAEFDGKINSWTSVPLPTYEAMKTADSKIKNSCVTGWGSSHLLTLGEKRITNDGYWVSEEFLEMFEFPLAYGDPSTVLDEPSSIVLTESFAKSLFGDEDPLGQIIRLDDEADVKVTGILKDVPQNSSFEFEYLIPWKLR
ncbi:MAG: ABC transporter permease, partial [Fulvivirga sp.]